VKIAIGSDHAGFAYKEAIKQHLTRQGHTIQDFGAFSDERSDYPVVIRPVAEAVAKGLFERGIVLGGSGNGEAIVSNRVPGIRCAVCWNEESARLAKSHNDANIISLGQRMMTESTALAIVDMWLQTKFEGGRHAERIRMIDEKPK
jgi:ribose 5-phosphate isomerase B